MKSDNDMDEMFTVGDVNREAAGTVSPQQVRNLADTGVLPSVRTAGGVRLFRRRDVERVLAERKKSKE